jgi:hypothetical protein
MDKLPFHPPAIHARTPIDVSIAFAHFARPKAHADMFTAIPGTAECSAFGRKLT